LSRTYRATIRCSYVDGTLAQPSLHYQTDLQGAQSEPDPSDVAGEIWAHIGSLFASVTHVGVTINELVVSEEVLKPNIGVTGAILINSLGVMPMSAEDLPRELVGIINIHSGAATRSGRGYMTLVSPGAELYTANRFWTQQYKTGGDQLASVLHQSLSIGAVNPSDIHPVVYSRKRHQAGLTPYTFRVQSAAFNERPKWRRSRGTTP